MYYTYEVTAPTRIKCADDYKDRMYEITHGQIKNVFLKERFLSPFFWLFAIFFIPCSAVYLALCLLEIVIDTLLFPLSCIPYLRGLATFVSIIVWSLGVAIGVFSLVPLTYDLKERPQNKPSNAKYDETIEVIRQAIIAKQMEMAQDMYIHYGAGDRFQDDMGLLCEEYRAILMDGERSCGARNFYNDVNGFSLGAALRKCTATSMYYIFDIGDLNYNKNEIIGTISQIIFNERLHAKSFFDSASWFEVRLALIEKIKGFVNYSPKRYAI